jgi:sterol-4alpha-carboxylate 3-dehydrogenase (decarboxylating)
MLTCALRQCTTFGPDDPAFFGNIVEVVKNDQAKYRFGGEDLFDFIYVGSACHTHLLAARALLTDHGTPPLPASDRVEGDAFNVMNDEHIPFWDLTIRTSNLLRYPLSHDDLVPIPKAVALLVGFLADWMVWLFSLGHRRSKLSVSAVQYTYCTHTMNISKAKTRLNYTPRFTLQEGLEKTVDWYKDKDKKQ